MLFGLYDLNSEFYVTDASALLIHPSFGIGIDFSQSGRNGPSIFPNLGLSLRARQQLGGGYYLQGAIIDGVPGDPQTPGRTSVRLGHDDGALLVTEVGWQQRGADGPMPGHWAVGVWHYTQRSDRVDASDREHNQGFYALAQAVLSSGDGPRTIALLRTGAANRQVNAVDFAVDAGVLVDQPFGKSGPASFTAGVTLARFGDARRTAQTAMSVAMASHETAFEIGARWQLLPSLAVQPLLQHVWHVAGHQDTNATIVGVRIEWALRHPRIRSPLQLLFDHVGAERRREAKGVGRECDAGAELAELQQRALVEGIDDLDRGEVLAAKADVHGFERAFLGLRRGLHPIEPILRGQRRQIEFLVERTAREQRRRRRAERSAEFARARLVQVGVKDPDLLAIGDDELLERLRVGESKSIRARELEAAA